MIKSYWALLLVLPKLGLLNIVRVALYRFKLGIGYLRWKTPQTTLVISGKVFKPSRNDVDLSEKHADLIIPLAQQLLSGSHSMFGKQHINVGAPPQWFQFNEFSVDTHWSEILINHKEGQDIKATWELSRFYWAPILAAAYSITKEEKYLSSLNEWVDNWQNCNPHNYSVNWVCAQEVAIRMINLLNAAYLLRQINNPSSALTILIEAHCSRIFPTLQYSISQDNNHGSSEAAALFIGGAWLISIKNSKNKPHKYYNTGRKWLEDRAKHLFDDDGGSIQYSTNYHRVIVDTYSMVEVWRRLLDLPKFSVELYSSLRNATNWLYQMVQPEMGGAPNLGANDGSMLLPLTTTDYRDYRPSVQLASVLFTQKLAYKTEDGWNLPLQWFNIQSPKAYKSLPSSSDFSKNGYSLLRKGNAFVLFNIPQFKFRPSQSDALHIDLWLKGENLLRDGGTFSYNAGDDATQYFGGVASHNTVQFDNHDQMPRLSRFLLGAWLKAKEVEPITIDAKGDLYSAASYQDYKGAYHHRSVKLSKSKLTVIDTLKGFKQNAILRWRLKTDNWTMNQSDKTVTNNKEVIHIQSNAQIIRFEIIEGWESLYYLQKTRLPVLEIEIQQPSTLITEYKFNV